MQRIRIIVGDAGFEPLSHHISDMYILCCYICTVFCNVQALRPTALSCSLPEQGSYMFPFYAKSIQNTVRKNMMDLAVHSGQLNIFES